MPTPISPERRESLQEALDDFNATLNSLRFTGASQAMELSALATLVKKYPEQARALVADLSA